jgi:hypothetical protein
MSLGRYPLYVFNSYNEIYYHIDKYLHTQKAEKKICIILLQIHTHNIIFL